MTDKTVWKFTAGADGVFRIEAPAPQDVFMFAEQGKKLCVWIEVYPTAPKSRAEFQVFGTGHEIPANAVWVQSCLAHGGAYVWHLYQTKPWSHVQ